MAGERLRVRLVVELEQLGPVGKDRPSVVAAVLRAVRPIRLVWAGTDFKQTAYRVVDVREEVAADV